MVTLGLCPCQRVPTLPFIVIAFVIRMGIISTSKISLLGILRLHESLREGLSFLLDRYNICSPSETMRLVRFSNEVAGTEPATAVRVDPVAEHFAGQDAGPTGTMGFGVGLLLIMEAVVG